MSAEASGREGVIIVLTDGGESCGDNPVDAASSVFQMTLPRKISRMAPMAIPVAYADAGDIVVSVIGFDIGDPTVEQQLRDIATAGGGQYYAAADAAQLSTALKQGHVTDRAMEPAIRSMATLNAGALAAIARERSAVHAIAGGRPRSDPVDDVLLDRRHVTRPPSNRGPRPDRARLG